MPVDSARVFGLSVRRTRLELGLKQGQLAALVGISVPMLSVIERGHLPSMDVALKLAQYFNMPLSVLLGDLAVADDDEPAEPADAVQIRVLALIRELAFAPIEQRALMADWIMDLGRKLHAGPHSAPPAPPPSAHKSHEAHEALTGYPDEDAG